MFDVRKSDKHLGLSKGHYFVSHLSMFYHSLDGPNLSLCGADRPHRALRAFSEFCGVLLGSVRVLFGNSVWLLLLWQESKR